MTTTVVATPSTRKPLTNGEKARMGCNFHAIVEGFVRSTKKIVRVYRGKQITYKGQSKRIDMTYQIVGSPFIIDDDSISSCRDDRLDAKQHKAHIIKKWRLSRGQSTLQILTLPDDFHFDGCHNKDSEVRAVHRALYTINHNVGLNYIDFAVKINDKEAVINMIAENGHMTKGHLKRKVQKYLNNLYDEK